MPRYEYIGDSPRTIPALGLEVEPGQQVEVAEEIRHPDFVLIAEKKAVKSAAKEES